MRRTEIIMDNRKEQGLTAEKLMRLFIEKWYICLISVVVTMLAGMYFFVINAPATYTAYTTIYVTDETEEKNVGAAQESTALTVNEKLAKDYAIIARSNRVLNTVKANMPNLDMPQSAIGVKAYPDSRILEVSVTGKDPVLMAEAANEITEVLIKEVSEIISKNNIQIIDLASVPQQPNVINPKICLIASFLVGLILGVLIILCVEIFDTRIKGPEDFKEHFNEPVLGVIPKYDRK